MEDALYLLPAWLGWLRPMLVGAAMGAATIMLLTACRLQFPPAA